MYLKWNQFMPYADENEMVPVNGLKMDQKMIEKYSVNAAHWYEQHSEMWQNRMHAPRYLTHMILASFDSKQCVELTFDNILAPMERKIQKYLDIHSQTDSAAQWGE